MPRIGLRLTPHGRLLLEDADDASMLDDKLAARLSKAFADGTGPGLVQLGAGEVGQTLPPAFLWWRAFAARYVGALCLLPAATGDGSVVPEVPPPGAEFVTTIGAVPIAAISPAGTVA